MVELPSCFSERSLLIELIEHTEPADIVSTLDAGSVVLGYLYLHDNLHCVYLNVY